MKLAFNSIHCIRLSWNIGKQEGKEAGGYAGGYAGEQPCIQAGRLSGWLDCRYAGKSMKHMQKVNHLPDV